IVLSYVVKKGNLRTFVKRIQNFVDFIRGMLRPAMAVDIQDVYTSTIFDRSEEHPAYCDKMIRLPHPNFSHELIDGVDVNTIEIHQRADIPENCGRFF